LKRNPIPLAAILLSAGVAAALAGAGPLAEKPPNALLWPLPIHEGCPSLFGDFRSNHFHGGIDLRTHREEGWPVLAPGDGIVERIRREPSGYGRVLYLRLDDGRTIVFGHLCRYEGGALGLEQALQKACAKEGTSFPGDISFNPQVRVKAGQRVAYSGQLGIGAPHLHMEVRSGDEQLDPFTQGLPLPDGLSSPRILGLSFVPRDASSLVDGSILPVRAHALRRGDGTYALDRPVQVQGRVDAAVVADDSFGTEDIRCGVNNAWALLDGNEFFRADIRRFELKQTFQGPAFWIADLGFDHAEGMLLRKDTGVNIPGIDGEGLPELSAPEGALRVSLRNRAGHTSTVTATLRRSQHPLPLRNALPGRGFKVSGSRFLPGGLLLELKRRSHEGESLLALGGREIRGFLVEVGRGDVLNVLVPGAAFPSEVGALSAGGEDLGISVAAGPAVLTCNGIRLEVPEGALGMAEAGGGSGLSAAFRVAPPALRPKAKVITPKGGGRGSFSVGAGGRFLGTGGGEFPYKGDGTYALRTDSSAPTWGKPFQAVIPHIEAREVRIPIRDSGSGPDLATLRVKLDGKPVYPDWDVDAGLVRIDVTEIRSGPHSIEGVVSDRAGNRAVLKKLAVTLPRK
jgi:hypothetical protein